MPQADDSCPTFKGMLGRGLHSPGHHDIRDEGEYNFRTNLRRTFQNLQLIHQGRESVRVVSDYNSAPADRPQRGVRVHSCYKGIQSASFHLGLPTHRLRIWILVNRRHYRQGWDRKCHRCKNTVRFLDYSPYQASRNPQSLYSQRSHRFSHSDPSQGYKLYRPDS